MSIFLVNMYQKLKEVDQEIQRGPMSIFLKYLLKAGGSRPGDPQENS